MKKFLFLCMALCTSSTLFTSCDDTETYADQKEAERKAINSFLSRNVNITTQEGDTICKIGRINVISEAEFYAQDSTTNLDKNEYVLFSSTGIYMQLVRKGAGEKMQHKDRKILYCRFLEYNIMGDSIALYNSFTHVTQPEVISVSNNFDLYTASFTTLYQGGMVYHYGHSSNGYSYSVPSGWLTPLSYIKVGRQVSPDQEIAKVRIIIPHSEGHTVATSTVRPFFYEISYQEGRN